MLRCVVIGSIFAGSAVMAEPLPLLKSAIHETLTGATLEIDAPMGNKLPVTYEADGKMVGKAGSLAFFLGSSADSGRWWVANDTLCNRWTTWFEGKTQCLTLKRDGERIAWTRDDGETGTATIVSRASKPALGIAAVVTPRLLNPAPASSQIASLGGPMAAALPMEEAAQAPPRPAAVSIAPRKERPVSLAIPVNPQRLAADAASSQASAAKRREQTAIAASPSKSVAIGPSLKVAGVAEDDVLNVRRGPAEHFPPVGALPPRAQGVQLLGPCHHDWCPVQHGFVRGWVHGYYLAADIAE